MTDNKNRTVAEVRHVFAKYNGNLGDQGCVSWMFSRKGLIIIDKNAVEEEKLMELVLENGAEDMRTIESTYEIITSVEDFSKVKEAIEKQNITIESAEVSMIPSTYIKLEGKPAEQMLRLIDRLEELDDIQNVWSNEEISDEEMKRIESIE